MTVSFLPVPVMVGGVDYGAYGVGGAGTAGRLPDSVLAAGTTNDTHAYYQSIGGIEAPSGMVSLYPELAGVTRPGASGLAWREMVIEKTDDTVTWSMDGLLLATVENYSSMAVGGNNIFFGFYDQYPSKSESALLFGLIDNVEISVIPEPATYALIAGIGFLGFAVWRRSRKPVA